MRDNVAYRTIRWVVLVLLGLFVVFPLITMLSTALQSSAAASAAFTWIPSHLGFHAFVGMWQTAPLAQYFVNSILISIVATLISVLLGVAASYSLTRFRFAGKRFILYSVLSTQAFPGVLFLLPLFVLYSGIQRATGFQLIGSYTGLIIVDLTFALPFSIWVLTNYLSSVPRDVEEAAMVDGCSQFTAFIRVTLPMALPGLAAVFVFTFITAWSELLFASVLSNAATRTLPVGLQSYLSPEGNTVFWNQLMAASILVSIPIVAGFLSVQRFFVRGLSLGAVK
jgi:multiple sugar transport system permease protein